MSRVITLGSLFDGSGGFPLAGMLNGITPFWASEIEPFAISVTKARFPNMVHLGSVTDINGAEIPPVDIITFGSPCQDLSIAGKRNGIHDGQRSNLFFEAIRIIREMREHDRASGRATESIRPRFAVWENVPGAFSSNGGEDFRAVLQAFADTADGERVSIPRPKTWESAGCIVGDGWSLAWRVYDAQYWPGTPQRRRRIYLIADFAGERAGEILFKPESVPRSDSAGQSARQTHTADVAGSSGGSCIAFLERAGKPGGGKGLLTGNDRAFALTTNSNSAVCYSIDRHYFARQDFGKYVDEGVASNLTAHESKSFADIITERKGRKYAIRRLTPTECARLQGFPDWWTDGVKGTDSQKYRLWGNGVALPCVKDVLRRVVKAIREGEDE